MHTVQLFLFAFTFCFLLSLLLISIVPLFRFFHPLVFWLFSILHFLFVPSLFFICSFFIPRFLCCFSSFLSSFKYFSLLLSFFLLFSLCLQFFFSITSILSRQIRSISALSQSVLRLATGRTFQGQNPGVSEVFRTRPVSP